MRTISLRSGCAFVSDELLYGYTIFQHLEYRPTTRTLINIKNGRIKRFGTTKARLFEYLLSGMDEGIVYDNDIIVHVFEDHGLRCSRSYLLSMIKKFKMRLIPSALSGIPLQGLMESLCNR
jgi:hypothetical protein